MAVSLLVLLFAVIWSVLIVIMMRSPSVHWIIYQALLIVLVSTLIGAATDWETGRLSFVIINSILFSLIAGAALYEKFNSRSE